MKKNYGYFYLFLVKIFKLFKRKYKFVNPYNHSINEKCILVANHAGASGPINYSCILPTFHATWGAYDVQGNYKERFLYLYHIFYIQKKGYNKFISFILASLFAIISRVLYRSSRVIPTYQNSKLKQTINTSIDYLSNDIPILIFPENSSEGYHKKISKIEGGFLLLSKMFYKEYNIDLKIYPLYFDQELLTITMGNPILANELLNNNISKDEVIDLVKNKINELADI